MSADVQSMGFLEQQLIGSTKFQSFRGDMNLALNIKKMKQLRRAFEDVDLEENVSRIASKRIELVTLDDIAWIAARKTSGPKHKAEQQILSNNEDSALDALRRAHLQKPAEAVRGLIDLKGVGVATASAILCWTDPARWPVIDIHAWDALARLGYVADRSGQKIFKCAQYSEYCALIFPAAKELGWPCRDIDRWLYSFGKAGLTRAGLDDLGA